MLTIPPSVLGCWGRWAWDTGPNPVLFLFCWYFPTSLPRTNCSLNCWDFLVVTANTTLPWHIAVRVIHHLHQITSLHYSNPSHDFPSHLRSTLLTMTDKVHYGQGPCLPTFITSFIICSFLSSHTGLSAGPREGQPHSYFKVFALAISFSRNTFLPAPHMTPSHIHWNVTSSKLSLPTLYNLTPPHHSSLLFYFLYSNYNYLKLYCLLIYLFL